jgi:hypothetical protein
MEESVQEYNELISTRVVGKGDTWVLVGEEAEHLSLTDALEAWFDANQENVEFRLDPLGSKLYVIRTEKVDKPIEVAKKYNLYGDPM